MDCFVEDIRISLEFAVELPSTNTEPEYNRGRYLVAPASSAVRTSSLV